METADHNLVALLNGDEEKENYQHDINPGLNELLSITDAAVQAIDNKNQPKEMGPAKPLSSVQPSNHQLHSLSPDHIMALYGDGELDKSLNEFEPISFRNSPSQANNVDPHSSIHSKSSTASEVLIRSTNNNNSQNTNNSAKETHDAQNMSCLSARSDVSVASSGFLTGSAHRVKVSSKKLKEVRSPFENLQPISKSENTQIKDGPGGPLSRGPPCVTVSAGDVAPPIISINPNKRDAGQKAVNNRRKERNTNEVHNRKEAGPKAYSTAKAQERSHQQYQVERHVTKQQMTNILAKNKIEPKDCSSTDESLNNSKQVYRDLQNDCVITDVHGSEYNMDLNNSQTSSKKSFDPDLMATTSSKINAEVASNASSKRTFGFTDTGSLFIEDVIAGAMNDSSATPSLHTSGNEDLCSQPEIVTIPDSIVTVTAQDKLAGNTTSGSDASSDNYPYALQDRFGKYRPAGVLRQGAPVDGVDPQRCHLTSDSDITVTQYGLSDRERQIRSNFVRRQHHGGPIKRVVQPKVIHTGSSTVTTHTTSVPSTTTSDAITTAAVAASAAVAATQPFLRAQQEVEHRMAEILEKLAVLQGTNPPMSALGSTMGSTAATEKSAGAGSEGSGRVEELEKQLGDLTQRRLDYLEKMQEQQMTVQAKLLSISRLPGAAPSDDLENYSSHSRRRPTGVSSGHDDHSRADKYKNYSSPPRCKAKEEREKSVLDTPAPRKKPPTPMLFDGSNKKSRSPHRSPTRGRSGSAIREKHVPKGRPKPFGFLEEILSGHDDTPLYGPFDQTPPNSLPSAPSRSRLEASPSAVNQANELVNELKDLKHEMRNVLVGAPHVSARHQNIQPEERAPAFASFNTSGPFPLDDFLKSAAAVSSSPYPSLRPVPARGSAGALSGPNAPIVQKYTDAEDTLQKVQQSRAYLETNLDAILRRHQDAEVVTFLEELTRDASATERLRIKKMVDKHIASMNTELQREIMEDMLKIEEAQKRNISVMVAERDTNAKFKARPGVKAKGKVGSRIDTGLKKAGPSEPARKPTYGRAAAQPQPAINKPRVSLPKKQRVGDDSETYLTRVYGKSLYHGMRNTQRDPKVRYSAASPAAKLAHSPPRLAAKAQQQRAASGAPPGVQGGNYYFTPSTSGQQQVPTHSGVVTNPVEGHLIPMAIPLGAPRQESGGRPGGPWSAGRAPPSSIHSTPQAAESAPFASTPLENHVTPRPQMSLQEEEDSVHPPGAPVCEASAGIEGKDPAISPIRQPSPRHHDDSVSSETATTARQQQVAPPQPQPVATTQQEPDGQLAGYEQDFEEDEDDEDTVTESWDEGAIALPGHQPAPVQPYHGPSFPPRAPALTPANSSDVLGSDLRRKDIVANKAMEWVEQELLARLLSEIAEQRAREEAMRRPPTVEKPKTRTRSPNDSQYSDTSSIPSEREPLHAEAIGREGLQMFVDAGVPVDDKLVSALIKEVLQEKVTSMTGQLTATDDDGPTRGRTPGAGQDPSPRPRSRPQSPNKQLVNDNKVPPPKALSSPLPTPEVTPRTSPRLTPRRWVSPPATPDLTPVGSVADPAPLAPQPAIRPPVPDPDSTDTESIPFEEYRPPPIMGASSEVLSPTFVPRHDVRTPSATPPPSPPPGDVTPELSIQEEPPKQPVPVPRRVQTQDTGVMVNMVKIIRAYEDAQEEEEDDLEMVVVERSSRKRPVEQKPPREPSPPPAPKEPTPSPSPQPTQEESDQEEEEVVPPEPVRVEPKQQPPRPEPITIATQTAPERTPSPTSTATQDDSTATEVTMDEAISEGEWLLTMHSEGEVRPVPLLHAAALQRGGDRGRGGGRRIEVDDTLHDYSDFDLDDGREQSADFSEGEFLHRGGVPPEQDPMLAYLYQMQNQPMKVLEEQLRISQMAAAGHYPPPGQQVDKSLGEVSFYQGQRMQIPGGGGPRPILVQSGSGQEQQQQQQHLQQQQQSTINTRKLSPAAQSIGEAPSPGEVEGSSTSADSISDTQVDLPHPPPHPNQPTPKGPPEQEELHPVKVQSGHPQVSPLGGDTREDEVTDVKGHDDVNEEVPPSGINLTKAGDINISPAASMERAPRLSDARKSGMMGGPIMSTENVSRGGRRGGRPAPRGRFGGAGRPQTPDDGHGRVIQVRSSQESDLQDTMESVDGLRSTAGSDLRTMTPDQMNMEALLQSGQYLNTTISSDGGSTTDFGRTGEIGTVRSTDFTRSEEFGIRSGVATREFGTRSGEFGTRSEDFGTRSGEPGERFGGMGTRGSVESGNRSHGELDEDGLMSGTFGRSGRLNYTTTEFEQSGSENSYHPGETEGSQDLQGTGHYADSLEGTGPLEGTGTMSRSYDQGGSQVLMRQSLQVSVTIPSMAQSDSGSEVSASVEDVSEISMAN